MVQAVCMVSSLYMFLTRVMVSKGLMGTAPRGLYQHQSWCMLRNKAHPRRGKTRVVSSEGSLTLLQTSNFVESLAL